MMAVDTRLLQEHRSVAMDRGIEHYCRCTMLCCLILAACVTTEIRAAQGAALDSMVTINIRPQKKLSAAVAALAKQAGVPIHWSGDELDHTSSRRLRGHMTLREALVRLLSGTHFGASETGEGAVDIVIDLTADIASSAEDTQTLRAGEASSPPAFGGAQVLSEIEVVSQYENNYTATTTSGPSRVDTDLMDTPQAISVITRKLLDDQQVQTLADAVLNASSVQLNSSPVILGNVFVFRGFSSYTGGILENGLSTPNAGFGSTTPIWGLDSVEVLKGAEAVLAGAYTSYGGLVNLVTKQPQATPIEAMSFAYGSYGIANLGWDSGGVLADDQDFTYRVVAQITRSGGDAAGHDGNHYGYYLAPSLRWKTEVSNVLVGVERSVDDGPIPSFALVPGGASPFANTNPIRVFGARDDGFADDSTRTYYDFVQGLFDSPWSFRSRGQYKIEEVRISFWDFTAFSPDAEGNGNGYEPVLSDLHSRAYTVQNDLQGKWILGPVTQDLLVGMDYTHFDASYGINGGATPPGTYNIFSSPPLPSVGDLVSPGPLVPSILTGEIGYLFEDQVAWGRWRGRFAVRDALFHSYGVGPDSQQWLPNYGLTYRITPSFAVYASSMEGYTPRYGALTGPGYLAPPETSRSYELGMKFDFAERRLALTSDVFRIRVNETAYTSPIDPSFVVLGPGQTSTGEEIELHGELAAGLEGSFAYANMSAQGVDVPIQGVSRNTGNMWLAYRFSQFFLQGYSIGVGLTARSATIDESPYSGGYYHNPGNARTDVHLGYTVDQLSFNLGVRDIFNRPIYDRYQLYSTSTVLDDVGISVLLTGKYQFQ